jgi:hypothetical protein
MEALVKRLWLVWVIIGLLMLVACGGEPIPRLLRH